MEPESGSVRIAVTNILPYFEWSGQSPIYQCKGFVCPMIFSVVHALQGLNLSVEMIFNPDRSTGSEASPRNWTGLIGMLSRKEADVLGAYYVVVPELDEVVEMTTSFGSDDFGVLSGPPMNFHSRNPSLFSAITPPVGASMVVFWLLVSCLYLFMSKVEADIYRRKDNNTLTVILLTLYGLLFQRGFENLPDTLSRRILVSGWLFMVLILTVELSGALSSKLAVEDAPERIDKLSDVLKYQHMRPYVPKGVGIDSLIQSSPDKDNRAVWRQIEKTEAGGYSMDKISDEMVEQVSEGTAVIVSYEHAHLNLLVGVACQRRVRPFYMAKEPVRRMPIVGLLRRGMNRRIGEALDQRYTRFGAMGFQERFHHEMCKSASPCFNTRGPQMSFKPTSLPEFVGAFKVLGIGLLISSIVLLLELPYFKITTLRMMLKEI